VCSNPYVIAPFLTCPPSFLFPFLSVSLLFHLFCLGSQNVLDWAVKQGVKRVVSASSAAVYGVPETLPITEKTLPSPLSPYAESKLQMEVLHERAFEKTGLSSVCLRFFNVYGPRQDPQNPYTGVISKFIDAGLSDSEIKILGTGKQFRDFVYVTDVAKAVLVSLTSQFTSDDYPFQIFNVGTGVQSSIHEVAITIREILGYPRGAIIQFYPAREGDIEKSVADVSAIKRFLDWKSSVNLLDGLRHTVDWLRESRSTTKLPLLRPRL